MDKAYYRGQTLLELMIALSLSAFLLLGVLHFYSHSQRQNQQILLRLQLQSEIHKVLQLMGKDIRRAGFRAANAQVAASREGANFPLFEQPNPPAVLAVHPMQDGNQCVLFFYDLNGDGCVGRQRGGLCIRSGHNATDKIQDELFGYRLNKGILQTRSTYGNSVNAQCAKAQCQSYLQAAACTANSGWTALLDETVYEVLALRIEFVGRQGLEIYLKGRLKRQQSMEYESRLLVPLLNGAEG